MTLGILGQIDNYNDYATSIIGKSHEPIAKYVNENDRRLIVLSYGASEVRIRIDGYNMMYIMQSLYNNEVTNALLK